MSDRQHPSPDEVIEQLRDAIRINKTIELLSNYLDAMEKRDEKKKENLREPLKAALFNVNSMKLQDTIVECLLALIEAGSPGLDDRARRGNGWYRGC